MECSIAITDPEGAMTKTSSTWKRLVKPTNRALNSRPSSSVFTPNTHSLLFFAYQVSPSLRSCSSELRAELWCCHLPFVAPAFLPHQCLNSEPSRPSPSAASPSTELLSLLSLGSGPLPTLRSVGSFAVFDRSRALTRLGFPVAAPDRLAH